MALKQQCTLWNVWGTWLGIPVLVIAAALWRGWPSGLFVLVVAVIAQVLYLRIFPSISGALGYGSVADEPHALTDPTSAVREVTLYAAGVCPFCPLVRSRLEALQNELGFDLQAIDLTFRPELARSKGIRGVPVVEVEGRLLRGNATTAELAAFIASAGRGAEPDGDVPA